MKPATKDILHEIWSLSEGDHVFLPTRTPGGAWHEGSAWLPETINALPDLVSAGKSSVDHYFTPLRYTVPKRRRENVGRAGVLFADMDDDAVIGPYQPHLLIASSPTHFHAYWFLDRPYELEEWEPHARGLSHALNADPGGWDSTQVLRIPETLNYKYEPAFRVHVVDYRPEIPRYRLDDFPELSAPKRLTPVEVMGEPGPADIKLRNTLLHKYWEYLSIENRHLLTMTPDQAKWGVRDRSKVIHMVASALLEVGATVEEAFVIINTSPWNKFANRPKYLWEGIAKIAASRETISRD